MEKITHEDVANAAHQVMKASGSSNPDIVSVRKVRELTGRGSMTTIQIFLREWKAKFIPGYSTPEDLLEKGSGFAADIYKVALEQARAELKEERRQDSVALLEEVRALEQREEAVKITEAELAASREQVRVRTAVRKSTTVAAG